MTEELRTVPTGLTGPKANDILNSVLGQLSDGIWEEANNLRRFWHYAHVGKDNSILVSESYGSAYRGKTDDYVRGYFAKKIVQIVKIWKEDNPELAGDEDADVSYLSYGEHITVADAKAVVKALRHYGETPKAAGTVKDCTAAKKIRTLDCFF